MEKPLKCRLRILWLDLLIYFGLNVTEFSKVERLLKKSEFSEGAIRSQYRSFMSICPDGVMSREKFLQLAEVINLQVAIMILIFFL